MIEWRTGAAGSLVEFLAVRLLLDRLALAWLPASNLASRSLAELNSEPPASRGGHATASVDQRAFLVFQLAQVRAGFPADSLLGKPGARPSGGGRGSPVGRAGVSVAAAAGTGHRGVTLRLGTGDRPRRVVPGPPPARPRQPVRLERPPVPRSGQGARGCPRAPGDGRGYELRVSDNGVGPPPGEGHRVIRVVLPGGPCPGAGLGVGLAVVRLLVEQSGGTSDRPGSEDGRGTDFVLTLPRYDIDDYIT